MKKLTYTTTVNVVKLKKDLRWYKEQKAKLNKLIKASQGRLQECKYSKNATLEEYQLKLLQAFYNNVLETVSNIQKTIQKERQTQFDNAKKHAELKGLDISIVKGEMLKYNERRVNKG